MKKVNIKKFLVLFSLLVCVFCMTACDSSNGTISTTSAKLERKNMIIQVYQSYLEDWTTDMITYLDQNDSAKITSDAESALPLALVNGKQCIVHSGKVLLQRLLAFITAGIVQEENFGALKSIGTINIALNKDTGKLCMITVDTAYEKNDKVSFEFVINDDFSLENGAINPSYTTGQKMYKAVMNTIIGMGTVFIVLIFISFIIGLFKYISVFENKKKAKNDAHQQMPRVLIMQ